MIPTKEQIQEFWEKWGLVYKDYTPSEVSNSCEAMCIDRPPSGWYDQEGKLVSFKTEPKRDLNNLFKYAVPTLKKEFRNWKSVLHDWVDDLTGDYEKDALALFEILYKAFGGEV